MTFKLVGAAMILLGSCGVGLYMASNHRLEIRNMRLLIAALDYMVCELRYRQTPLPELFRQAGSESHGSIKRIFAETASEMDRQIAPDAAICFRAVLSGESGLSPVCEYCLNHFAVSLGKFDLDGQIESLESVRSLCRTKLEDLERNKDSRIRSYQTLSICAGAALAVLLI